MVCGRCVMSVREILSKLGIDFHEVLVGEIHLCDDISDSKRDDLKSELLKIGLELIDSRIGGLVEKIKQLVIAKARNEVKGPQKKIKLSAYLAGRLNFEYTYLSKLFSDVEGRTIENYFITQRIEKAKELLVYGQLNLSEIAFELDYSSVAHLSAQFKKVTGLTPSHFKEIGTVRRTALDQI